jgi:hypothetical protein
MGEIVFAVIVLEESYSNCQKFLPFSFFAAEGQVRGIAVAKSSFFLFSSPLVGEPG